MTAPRMLFALGLAASAPAWADPRIATHFYQPSEVVVIHGRGDTQSTIAFAPDERIENVAVGDSVGWQVAPNKRADLLFLKPTRPGARTNMTVVTDQRTYLFDLVAAPRQPPLYMLRFTYPAPPPRPAPPVVAAPTPAAPAVAAVAPPPDPATFDFAWTMRGDRALLPARLFDDGRSTYLAWPRDTPLPAILTADERGGEGPVNYTTRGDVIIVDGVPARLVLRAGRKMATLTPQRSDPPGDAGVAAPPPGARVAMNPPGPGRPFAHVLDGRP
ncbi:TrbG/VirB9 family P-type conjugative transfer protein [Sphingomonas morindae]|uniref:TrbG/VirB9 family P-type conjugative transfer protein n=1 Tax=Sphingomonas morindae TaxID=1541170 RepID=A0ABY4X9C2_9SPHN|nr:TrbG/VirB9 family P-type conjugative transfer protein [Sphingomonas morindae]USI73440.1 TrbG/VirB9 family P-type conjugative transfer protein [Sphingomonas morindae]